MDVYAPRFIVDLYPDPAAVQALLDAEDHPAARAASLSSLVNSRAAEAVRRSGFLDQLPKEHLSVRAVLY